MYFKHTLSRNETIEIFMQMRRRQILGFKRGRHFTLKVVAYIGVVHIYFNGPYPI